MVHGPTMYAWSPQPNLAELPGYILRDHKKFTAKAVVKAIEENPQESRREWLMAHLGKAGGGIPLKLRSSGLAPHPAGPLDIIQQEASLHPP